jgi:hypothetical protein
MFQDSRFLLLVGLTPFVFELWKASLIEFVSWILQWQHWSRAQSFLFLKFGDLNHATDMVHAGCY